MGGKRHHRNKFFKRKSSKKGGEESYTETYSDLELEPSSTINEDMYGTDTFSSSSSSSSIDNKIYDENAYEKVGGKRKTKKTKKSRKTKKTKKSRKTKKTKKSKVNHPSGERDGFSL